MTWTDDGFPGTLKSVGASLSYERDGRQYFLTPTTVGPAVFDVHVVIDGVPHWRRTAPDIAAARADFARELGHGDPALERECLRDLRIAAWKLALAVVRLHLERTIEADCFPVSGSRNRQEVA